MKYLQYNVIYWEKTDDGIWVKSCTSFSNMREAFIWARIIRDMEGARLVSIETVY